MRQVLSYKPSRAYGRFWKWGWSSSSVQLKSFRSTGYLLARIERHLVRYQAQADLSGLSGIVPPVYTRLIHSKLLQSTDLSSESSRLWVSSPLLVQLSPLQLHSGGFNPHPFRTLLCTVCWILCAKGAGIILPLGIEMSIVLLHSLRSGYLTPLTFSQHHFPQVALTEVSYLEVRNFPAALVDHWRMLIHLALIKPITSSQAFICGECLPLFFNFFWFTTCLDLSFGFVSSMV